VNYYKKESSCKDIYRLEKVCNRPLSWRLGRSVVWFYQR